MAAREHVQLVHGPNCACTLHRQERAEAAAKVRAATSKPVAPAELKLEPAARVMKSQKAVLAVTPKSVVTQDSGKPSESRKRGRPRVLSDEQRREKVRQRVAGWRVARRKGKVQ